MKPVIKLHLWTFSLWILAAIFWHFIASSYNSSTPGKCGSAPLCLWFMKLTIWNLEIYWIKFHLIELQQGSSQFWNIFYSINTLTFFNARITLWTLHCEIKIRPAVYQRLSDDINDFTWTRLGIACLGGLMSSSARDPSIGCILKYCPCAMHDTTSTAFWTWFPIVFAPLTIDCKWVSYKAIRKC